MKIFDSSKASTKSTFVSTEDKLKKEIKSIHYWRVFWRTATTILIGSVLFLSYMNIKVNNEITVLKTKIDTEHALKTIQSVPTASTTLQSTLPTPHIQQASVMLEKK